MPKKITMRKTTAHLAAHGRQERSCPPWPCDAKSVLCQRSHALSLPRSAQSCDIPRVSSLGPCTRQNPTRSSSLPLFEGSCVCVCAPLGVTGFLSDLIMSGRGRGLFGLLHAVDTEFRLTLSFVWRTFAGLVVLLRAVDKEKELHHTLTSSFRFSSLSLSLSISSPSPAAMNERSLAQLLYLSVAAPSRLRPRVRESWRA